jgi:hypothetical protein
VKGDLSRKIVVEINVYISISSICLKIVMDLMCVNENRIETDNTFFIYLCCNLFGESNQP